MQIDAYEEPTVQRDLDLTREILLKVEAESRLDGNHWLRYSSPEELGITGHSVEEVGYHLDLLIEEGFVKGRSGREVIPALNKMTWKGHELLDDIRGTSIWESAKERAKGLGGVGIAFMWELAKAEIKHRLSLP
jgi:hypothetical protein